MGIINSFSLNELQFILFAGDSHAKFHMIDFNSMKSKNLTNLV